MVDYYGLMGEGSGMFGEGGSLFMIMVLRLQGSDIV